AFLFCAGLIPFLMARVPFKRDNVLYLALIFPVASFILLSGGNLELGSFLMLPGPFLSGAAGFWADYVLLTLGLCGAAFVVARGSAADPRPLLRIVVGSMVGMGIIIGLCAADFGLVPVETENWGGLLVTMVI